jgi:Cu(I)/Ag(I) efflux system periplasmic protein CusF
MMKQENSRKGDCTPGQDADCAIALDAYHPHRLSADPAANPNSTPRRREMK